MASVSCLLQRIVTSAYDFKSSNSNPMQFECFIRIHEILIEICKRYDNFSSSTSIECLHASMCFIVDNSIVTLPAKDIFWISDGFNNINVYDMAVASISLLTTFSNLLNGEERKSISRKLLKSKWLTFIFNVLDSSGINRIRSMAWKLLGRAWGRR